MWNLMSLLSMSRKMSETFCRDLLLNKKLMAELKGSVDLVLCDISNLCCTVLSELLEVPHVSVITVAFMEPLITCIIEMPEILLHMNIQPVKIAGNAVGKDPWGKDRQPEHLSFANRLKNTVSYFFAHMILTGELIPTKLWDDHAKSISKYASAYESFWKRFGLVLVSHDFAFTYPQPLYANVKMIGPVLPEPAKNLSVELEKFMSVNKKVVLVSFGTVLSQYNKELLNTLSVGLSKVPLQVLWKHSGAPPTVVGNNTKIVQWMPQNDILGHKSTVVFLTHGGLNSFQESVYHGVPVIVMPLFGDQHWSASVCAKKQLGVVLDKANLESQKVSEAVMEVLKNSIYKENVMMISKRLKRRKRTPAQEGADWIEYALENDGALHLRSPAGDLAFYQRYMLDVFLFISLIEFLLVYLIMKVLKCIFCRVTEQIKDKKKLL